jgi:hypothetical protein
MTTVGLTTIKESDGPAPHPGPEPVQPAEQLSGSLEGFSCSMTQQQDDLFLFRPKAELITAAAQPTPDLTVTALVGQF